MNFFIHLDLANLLSDLMLSHLPLVQMFPVEPMVLAAGPFALVAAVVVVFVEHLVLLQLAAYDYDACHVDPLAFVVKNIVVEFVTVTVDQHQHRRRRRRWQVMAEKYYSLRLALDLVVVVVDWLKAAALMLMMLTGLDWIRPS